MTRRHRLDRPDLKRFASTLPVFRAPGTMATTGASNPDEENPMDENDALRIGDQIRALLLAVPYADGLRARAIAVTDICPHCGADLRGEGPCHCTNDE